MYLYKTIDKVFVLLFLMCVCAMGATLSGFQDSQDSQNMVPDLKNQYILTACVLCN